MKILLGVIAVILVLGFASVCWFLRNILEKMQSVKSTADWTRAELIRSIKKRIGR